jgi:predicted nuclease of predicted toxin-antitoxin system
MKILIDMNIPFDWAGLLKEAGWETKHCRDVKPELLEDEDVMSLARETQSVLFTHNLHWGAVLALAEQKGPSVFQVITKELTVENIGPTVIRVLREVEPVLDQGALLQIDLETGRSRVHRLGSADNPPSQQQ